jgi:lipopolysaccharide export system protein LptA
MRNQYFIAAGILFVFSISSVSVIVSSVSPASAAEEKKEEVSVKAPGAKDEIKPEVKPETKTEVRSDAKSEVKEGPQKAQKKLTGKDSLMSGSDKEPTVITSEALTTDNNTKTALFKGSVVAKKGDKIMYADSMLVYYTESSDGESSNIDRIEATGKVKLVRGDRVITADKAVYYAGADERAVFTGSPRAIENKNMVTGTTMTYYMKDDRSVVENSKVFLVEKAQGSEPKKTKAKKAGDSKK